MECERPLKGMVCDIYNRCSTTEEAQTKAVHVQAEESRQLVIKLGGCIHMQYVEQESGTTKKNRKCYARLLEDIKSREISCVVIKSIDRLMRNASDWHEFVGLITRYDVKLFLYLERKFYEPEDAFLSGIKALIAEQYSRELSQKVNNAHRRRQQLDNGALTINSLVYGYTKCRDKYVICEAEAEFIRKIYALSIAGLGSGRIAQELALLGIHSRDGGQISPCTIRRIIKNPLYMGTVVENKSHYDFEMKKRTANDKAEWIYHRHRVPQIIDESTWQLANEKLRERSSSGYRRQTVNDIFCGKIFCGSCGASFIRRKAADTQCYRCGGKNKGAGCKNSVAFYAAEAEKILYDAHENDYEIIQKEWEKDAAEITALLCECFKDFNRKEREDLAKKQENIKNKKSIILEKLLDGIITDEDYCIMRDDLKKQEEALSDSIVKMQDNGETLQNLKRMQKIEELVCGEDFCRRLFLSYLLSNIVRITVYDDGRLEIIYRDKSKETLVYRHKNKKTLEKEEKIQEVYQCIKCGMKTAAEIAEKTGLSTGNVLLKTKELKTKGRITYDCGWKITEEEQR
jgi:DNA invertase Pin-like site-specific DNA recombinase